MSIDPLVVYVVDIDKATEAKPTQTDTRSTNSKDLNNATLPGSYEQGICCDEFHRDYCHFVADKDSLCLKKLEVPSHDHSEHTAGGNQAQMLTDGHALNVLIEDFLSTSGSHVTGVLQIKHVPDANTVVPMGRNEQLTVFGRPIELHSTNLFVDLVACLALLSKHIMW